MYTHRALVIALLQAGRRDLAVQVVASTEYPKAGGSVDGLRVGSEVKNQSSISSTLSDYTILNGIRKVPMADFEVTSPQRLFYAKNDIDRVEHLAEQIRQSKRIDPLIVVIDEKGPYVLEGGHRLAALHVLGVKHLPALVVLSHDD